MDWKKIFLPLLKLWWLIIIAAAIAGVSSFLLVRRQPPVYQAKSTLMIGRTIQDPNPSQGEFGLTQQLAQTYADIGNREPVQKAVKDALGLPELPENAIRAIAYSPLIEITVVDTDPKRAQVVANELANQLIIRSPSAMKPDEIKRQDFVNGQLDELQTQIGDTQDTIAQLQIKLGRLSSAHEIADMQVQIKAQQEKLDSLRTNYTELLTNTQKGASNIMALIEPAEVPTIPIGPKKTLITVLSTAVGFFLAVFAIWGIEALDDTLKTSEEIARITNTPILGNIGEMPKGAEKMTYMMEEPGSPIAESFRLLRTNLDFLGGNKPLRVILVTSSEKSDGKSTVSSNLAACLAQAKKRVVLVDADLRHPTVNKILKSPVRGGLYEICSGNISLQDALIPINDGVFKVIPTGVIPPNPYELFGSPQMSQVIDNLLSITDIIVMDCPPMFLADTMVLARKADGILIVATPGHTRRKEITKAVEQLRRINANVLGVVLNRVSENATYYQKGYYGNKKENGDKPKLSIDALWRNLSIMFRLRKE
jgi:capsular exopolysaccharide synthesis family protein